jgi:hypothetical protein
MLDSSGKRETVAHTCTHRPNNSSNHFLRIKNNILRKKINLFRFIMLRIPLLFTKLNGRPTSRVMAKRVECHLYCSVRVCLLGLVLADRHTRTHVKIVFKLATVAFAGLSHVTYCSEMRDTNPL